MKKAKSKKTDVDLIIDDLLNNDTETQAKETAVNKVNVRQWIQDAPVSNESVLPRYYTFTKDHAIIIKNDSDEEKSNFILPCPLFITGRAINPKTKKETVQLQWIRDGSWKFIEVERRYICKTNSLVDLADYGLPVTSDSAKMIIDYLRLYEVENMGNIPVTEVANQLGWNKEMSCFLFGETCLQPTCEIDPIAELDKETSWSNRPVVFIGKDEGENQISASLHSKGSCDAWASGINQTYEFPVVQFTVYTSLTAPFLKIFECENFSFEISSPTSTGKTSALQIAASCWGKPDESSGGFFRTWKTTKTAIERAAQALNGIPLIMDDTKHAPGYDKNNHTSTPLVTDSIYMISSGTGKSRGTLVGTEENTSFSTILMSSGESPSIDLTNDGGSRGRIISLWGLPFKDQSEKLNRFISKLDKVFANNYGHAGVRLVSFILNHKKDWNIWKEAYQEISDTLIAKQNLNSVQMRIIQNIAAVATAIPIIHAALPELNRDFSLKKLIDEIISLAINEIKIADNGSRFISYLSEYLMENNHMIWTKEKHLDNSQSASSPVSIYSDYDGNQWKFIGIKSNIFEHIIKENQINKNEVLRTLKSKNWLQLTSSGDKSYQKQVVMPRLGDSNAKSNMYCIKREAFESLRIFSW